MDKRKAYYQSRRKTRGAIWGYLFGGASIIGLLWFYIIPFVRSLFQTIIKPDQGMKELFLRSTFGQALSNTLLMILISIPLLLVFTAILTYFINGLTEKGFQGIHFWFAVHLIPMILPSVVIATVVKVFFAQYGLCNAFLVNRNIEPVRFLDSGWAFGILCIIFLWKNVGYSMVVLFSGVQSVDREQREAAALDGAGDGTIFFRIILPQLSVFLRFIIVMGIVGIFKLYRESYLILGDSPPDEAYMIQNFLNNNFASLNYDRTVIASALLIVIIGTLLFLLFRFTGESHEA